MQTVTTFVQLSLKKECEKKDINQYMQSKNKFRSVYTIKKNQSVHTINKTLLTKMILDTAVTSDLSHTLWKKSM